ncbi:aspartyl/asparaginyl beta-hydroxylase domain-containing protein [uncultured Sphingomonas sp.]|uniref:aspartyl/asparaginyl beta-hydroxylase domain-containing protein n=1 Tax=uncultured Sphingomonas sp. TaxID=158754 RepID=UPI0025D784FE|nr:aspartyl/asparaginyl beta-hydroxylase domain-containing protein [uncultured Sphingomonas sp.]
MDQVAVEQRLFAARQAQQSGRRDEANRLFREVVDQGGDHPLALNGLGVQALGSGDAAAAAALFQRAITADGHAPELWLNLARAHRALADDAAERAALEGALAIDQRHFLALVRLAELHQRRGEAADAAERWSGVLAIAPMVEPRTSAIEDMLAQARAFVVAHKAAFASAIDQGLDATRAGLAPGERRRVDASIDHMLGRRQIYANQCHGLHVPFLPAEEYFERHHFPWLAAIEGRTDAIRREFESLMATDQPGILPYVSMAAGTPPNKWSALDNKLDWGAFHLWRNGNRDDAACARCPETAAAAEALPLIDIPGRAPTIFFSLLQPGAHLPAHTGVTNARTIIHLPLIVPDGCRFRVGGETRHWREGKAWAFDDTIDHEAWNDSDRLRVVLIFDTWNPYLSEAERAMIRAFYRTADEQGLDVGAVNG